MILGLGNDLVDIKRIEQLLLRFGDNFKQKVFTDSEIGKATQRANSSSFSSISQRTLTNEAASYAKRFAAKEACVKALGTGFGKGIYYKDVEIISLTTGKPSIVLHGKAKEKLAEIAFSQKVNPQISISITDEYPYASAIVIISS